MQSTTSLHNGGPKTEIAACLDISVISDVIMQKSVQRCLIATNW